MKVLDSYDLQLLQLLQENCRIPQAELGERVNLSAAAVNRRIKRMTDDGIIEGFTAQIRPDALGHPLTVIVEVVVESERIDLHDTMRKSFRKCPNVQQCYYVTGESAFVLIMAVRDMAQYTQLTRELFFENNNVKRFKSMVAMERVKFGTQIPVTSD